MPSITLNGSKREFTAGQTILDVARAAEVEVPTLCWYPKLPNVANCRICLVSVAGQPKLVPSCGTAAADGMVVETHSEPAKENRKGVLQMLLERYPGEHLANGGRADPKNEFEKYVVEYGVIPNARRELPLRGGDERPGDPIVQHDMTQCILCTRCVRACEDIQEVGVLDVGDRGGHTHIIVGGDGDPDHVRLHLVRRVRPSLPDGGERFEFIPRTKFGAETVRTPDAVTRSVCPYCGVGCQIDIATKGDQVIRVTSPWIEEKNPNQGSTCVKGRFGYDFPQHKDRLTKPLIRKGWVREGEQWKWTGEWPRHREGPWHLIEEAGEAAKAEAAAALHGEAASDRAPDPR